MAVDGPRYTADRDPAGSLVGRERQLEQLGRMVDAIGARGGTIVVRGEAGIGKSALLQAAERRARALGARVATISGTQSEARYAFGALHRLLLPFLDVVKELPYPQRHALDVAFGNAVGEAPDVFLVGLGTLGALTESAAMKPVVLVVEDAHWLDAPSAEVLSFVARRVELEGVLLLFSVRDGVAGHLPLTGLPELSLSGLDAASSRWLLGVNGGGLPAGVQERILAEAAGNPLALIELPIAAAAALDRTRPDEPLPLTARLEAVFASRLDDLDAGVRTLLLCAALEDGSVAELSAVAEELLGVPVDAGDWATAAGSGLGVLAEGTFRFRHPLMRSAVRQAASAQQRRRAHAALAHALVDDPDRAVWHRAAAAVGTDDEVAAELVAAAVRGASRGGVDPAVDALERAAALTSDPRQRALRLCAAADLDLDAGAGERSVPLLREALNLGLPAHEAVRASYILETMSSAWSGASAVPRFAEIAGQLAAGGNDRSALDSIVTVGMRAFLGPLDDDTRQRVSAIVEGLDVPADDPQRLAALALIDPVRRAKEVVDELRRISPVGIVDARHLSLLGEAASAVWADNLALPFLQSAVEGLRAEGRLVWLAQTLTLQAWVDARRGAVRESVTAADEAARLARETRQYRYVPVADLARAAAVGGMGDEETAERLATQAEAALLPMGAHPLLALVAVARGRAALAAERPSEAYAAIVRIFTPTDTASQPFVRGWALADLAEAAVHGGGDVGQVRGILADWHKISTDTSAPHLVVQLAYASALLADEATAEVRFRDAMAVGADGWPFYAARSRLAYGEWLRRQHRDSDARGPLREAGQLFGALGQQRYADRALRELRATGERARRRTPEAWTELSPQELQIAQLAAAGLTNREIGQRLYLSHRTIGTHLHNLFPKLGITSRAQLRDVIGPPDEHGP